MRNKTTKTTMSLLLAGLLGATTAWAETPTTATTDVPVGGQASTMTHGRPNMATTNNPAVENPSAVGTMGAGAPMASDATATPMSSASSTSAMGAAAPVPQDHMRRSWFNSDPRLGTGEASTMVNGQPNADPNNPILAQTREERRADREFKHADARTRREQAIMGSRSAPESWKQPGGTPE